MGTLTDRHYIGQTEQARETLTRALEFGGNRDLPQLVEARKTLDALIAAQ